MLALVSALHLAQMLGGARDAVECGRCAFDVAQDGQHVGQADYMLHLQILQRCGHQHCDQKRQHRRSKNQHL